MFFRKIVRALMVYRSDGPSSPVTPAIRLTNAFFLGYAHVRRMRICDSWQHQHRAAKKAAHQEARSVSQSNESGGMATGAAVDVVACVGNPGESGNDALQ